MNIHHERILIIVDTLPPQFTVSMVRNALRERGVIESDILLRYYVNCLEAQGLLTSTRPDGRHVLYSIAQEASA